MPLLEVRDLAVSFATADGDVQAVRGLSFGVSRGQTLGLVGESGSGKSVATQTIVGLTQGARISGRASFEGRDLLHMDAEELRRLRGAEIALIFQDPLSSLHPHYRIGWQIVEAIRAHESIPKRTAERRAVELLRPGRDPAARAPSGGLSPSVLGRNATAGDDRHGACAQPEAAHRGRADDGARRHRPGPDHRADEGAAGRVRHGDHPDHARPQRRRRHRATTCWSCTPGGRWSTATGAASTAVRIIPIRKGCFRRCRAGPSRRVG